MNKDTPRASKTTCAYQFVGKWLAQKIVSIKTHGEPTGIKTDDPDFVNAVSNLLDEHDKLLKYCRIVVACHKNEDFHGNVAAITDYLIEQLKIEP